MNNKRITQKRKDYWQLLENRKTSYIGIMCGLTCRSYQCEKAKTLADGKRFIATKRFCNRYTGTSHCADDFKSTRNFQNCGGCHHFSICDTNSTAAAALSATEKIIVNPIVLVQVNGDPNRALLDTGIGVRMHHQHYERISKRSAGKITIELKWSCTQQPRQLISSKSRYLVW